MSAIPFAPEDTGLDSPAVVMQRLSELERDLAVRQNSFEQAARDWYIAQRDIKRLHAYALLESDEKSITEKKARADIAASLAAGAEHEAEYEAIKAVIRVLETRASVLMSVLKAQGRA